MEAGITSDDMALADLWCQRADDFEVYAADAVLHIHWNPAAPGLSERIMVKLEERLRFEMGFNAVVLQQDHSLELPGAVLIGVEPGHPLGETMVEEMGQVIVAIASHYFKVRGSSIG